MSTERQEGLDEAYPQLDLRLAPDVVIHESESGSIVFDVGERGTLKLVPPTPTLTEALRALGDGFTSQHRAQLERRDDFDSIRFEYYCLRLRKRRMLEYGLRGPDDDLVVVVPLCG